jgi:hypothetical protein
MSIFIHTIVECRCLLGELLVFVSGYLFLIHKVGNYISESVIIITCYVYCIFI